MKKNNEYLIHIPFLRSLRLIVISCYKDYATPSLKTQKLKLTSFLEPAPEKRNIGNPGFQPRGKIRHKIHRPYGNRIEDPDLIRMATVGKQVMAVAEIMSPLFLSLFSSQISQKHRYSIQICINESFKILFGVNLFVSRKVKIN